MIEYQYYRWEGGDYQSINLSNYTYVRTYMHACMHTSIQTYIHTNIQTYNHTNMQTYKHTIIQTYKHTNIHTYTHTNIQTYKHTDRLTDRQRDWQTDRHTDIQTYRHTDIRTYRHTHIRTYTHTMHDIDQISDFFLPLPLKPEQIIWYTFFKHKKYQIYKKNWKSEYPRKSQNQIFIVHPACQRLNHRPNRYWLFFR